MGPSPRSTVRRTARTPCGSPIRPPSGFPARSGPADAQEEEWFTANLDAGAVFVNGMTVSHQELPFGGIKRSGFGRELAADGIREFCNLKTVWKA